MSNMHVSAYTIGILVPGFTASVYFLSISVSRYQCYVRQFSFNYKNYVVAKNWYFRRVAVTEITLYEILEHCVMKIEKSTQFCIIDVRDKSSHQCRWEYSEFIWWVRGLPFRFRNYRKKADINHSESLLQNISLRDWADYSFCWVEN